MQISWELDSRLTYNVISISVSGKHSMRLIMKGMPRRYKPSVGKFTTLVGGETVSITTQRFTKSRGHVTVLASRF